VIRIVISAHSNADLARLEAAVAAAASFELVGSSLGSAGRNQLLADSLPDALLEYPTPEGLKEFGPPDQGSMPVARVWLVAEKDFAPALAAAQAIDSEVRAVLPAWASNREITAATEAAVAGLIVIHPDIAERGSHPSPEAAASPWEHLSPRESEVLTLLSAGLGNKQIAARLGISEHTVKFHVTSIFNKLTASSRAEAVAIGIRRGLISL
jgi:NarL family two-component system response regulator YdfI